LPKSSCNKESPDRASIFRQGGIWREAVVASLPVRSDQLRRAFKPALKIRVFGVFRGGIRSV
jgi:hypothetical protein